LSRLGTSHYALLLTSSSRHNGSLVPAVQLSRRGVWPRGIRKSPYNRNRLVRNALLIGTNEYIKMKIHQLPLFSGLLVLLHCTNMRHILVIWPWLSTMKDSNHSKISRHVFKCTGFSAFCHLFIINCSPCLLNGRSQWSRALRQELSASDRTFRSCGRMDVCLYLFCLCFSVCMQRVHWQ
jgi:hypothetical protein